MIFKYNYWILERDVPKVERDNVFKLMTLIETFRQKGIMFWPDKYFDDGDTPSDYKRINFEESKSF